jgi:hypothetical protein
MIVLVTVFNQSTSWSGRTITYEEGPQQFILQDHGPITAQKVLSYDAQGQLEWAREGLREWVYDFAGWERTHRPEARAAGQSSSESADSSKEPSTVRRARSLVVIPEAEAPARDAESRTRRGVVVGGAQSQRRRHSKTLLVGGVLVALVIVVATVATAHQGGDSGSGSRSGTPSPTPTTRTIVDPGVTLSPAITKFFAEISRAERHAYDAWMALNSGGLGAYSRQYSAALDDLRRMRAIQPKNDGSKQWNLAHRYAARVRHAVKYENRAVKDALASNTVAENKDFAAFKTWIRRLPSAHDKYSSYVYQENWAGYCAIGRRFTNVTATWTQPQLYANGTTDRHVAIWVGLDGVSGGATVEQTGIELSQRGNDSKVDSQAWYEMFPKPPVPIATVDALNGSQEMVVNAGDVVTATVTSLGDRRFRLTLVDNTRGEKFSIAKTSRAAKCNSAEIIVEAHFRRGIGFADFDPVHFTDCAVDGRPLAAFDCKTANIAINGGRRMTSTSALGADGASFTVTRR